MTNLLVIKIGGSLLATPGAMPRVASWLKQTTSKKQTRLLIAGGGPAVDGLRAIDRANPLPQQASHEGAIQIMDANTQLLASWLPGVVCRRFVNPQKLPSGDHAVLLGAWLRDHESALPGPRLSPGWQTTSDAIAARLAAYLEGGLVILKHECVGVYGDVESASAAGVIDAECPRIASKLPRVLVTGLPPAEIGRADRNTLGQSA